MELALLAAPAYRNACVRPASVDDVSPKRKSELITRTNAV